MANKVIKNKISRKTDIYEWGNLTLLSQENFCAINELTVNPGKTVEFKDQDKPAYFIIASGAAEFNLKDKKITLFKGEKLCLSQNSTDNFEIKNCGVIPLVVVEVILNNQE